MNYIELNNIMKDKSLSFKDKQEIIGEEFMKGNINFSEYTTLEARAWEVRRSESI